MRKILFLTLISLIAAGCVNQAKAPTQLPQSSLGQPAVSPVLSSTSSQSSDTNLSTYNSTGYGFSIMYPSEFKLSTNVSQTRALSYIPACAGNMIVCAFLNRKDYAGTNFDGAGVSVEIDSSLRTEAQCYDFINPYSEAQTEVPDVTINGIDFKSATGGGGAAGHFDKLQIYRNFHKGACYEISQDVSETDIGNYPSGTVRQFDENAVWQSLQGVVDTFMFKANQ